MTGRAVSQLLHFVFLHQSQAQRFLILGRLIVRVEHFRAGPKIILRRIVTIEAPPHIERLRAPGNVHLRDRTVTCGAADSLCDVNAVIEIDEVRHGIHACPGNRLGIAVAGADRLEYGRLGPYLRMAIHAGLRGRHARRGRYFDGRVAKPAIEPEFADVVLVA